MQAERPKSDGLLARKLLDRGLATEGHGDHVLQIHDVKPFPFHGQQRGSRRIEQHRVVVPNRDLPTRGQDQAKRLEGPLAQGL